VKVLLTGPFGNIGSHALPELLREGHQVRCFSLDTREHRATARGHGKRIEMAWGDVREPADVAGAVAGVEAVIHLAGVIPPTSDEDPAYARAVNVDGTRHLLEACAALPARPRFLFASTFDVHGHTLQRPPPRQVTDPLVATDPYTEQKIAAEALVQGSGLEWCIFRFSDVPIIGLRDPHPIMFEIGLDNRIESLHADDAAVALARALRTPGVWGRILFVGGGPSCQHTYREYLRRLLDAMGIGALPEEAFSTKEYATDWIDSSEAQALLHYQRRSFDDIVADIAACLGWKRRLVPVAAPAVRRAILELSPYWKQRAR
jgi:nucleoside-diphosphate-sugar epimerase